MPSPVLLLFPPIRIRRLKAKRRVFTCTYVFFVVVVIEFTCYQSVLFDWPLFVRSSRHRSDRDSLLRILLVADPQLIGYQNEGAVGLVSRWDSDRYLRRTFATVFDEVEPQLVVFLGDLFDEGSIADDYEFDYTYDRFRRIYPLDTLGVQHIFVPGDNDVGGEGWEPVKKDKKLRFSKQFKSTFNPTMLGLSEYYFLQANIFDAGHSEPVMVQGPTEQPGSVRVLVTHGPLTAGYHPYAEDVFVSIKPALIFSGHDHLARAIITHRNSSDYEYIHMKPSTDGFAGTQVSFPVNQDNPAEAAFEMQAPTCSYRMGVPEMGFGIVYIDRSARSHVVTYGVVWLPGRFKQLYAYCAAGLLLLVVAYLLPCLYRNSHHLKVIFCDCGRPLRVVY